jgi:hypothetical protein
MTKLAALFLAALLLFPGMQSQQSPLSKYPVLTAYRIRPLVIAFPRYTADGQLCELGLEQLEYLGKDGVNVDAEVDEKEIEGILDEVAPPAERGPIKPGLDGMLVMSGVTGSMTHIYENVTLDFASGILTSKRHKRVWKGYTSAVITWTKRTCQ